MILTPEIIGKIFYQSLLDKNSDKKKENLFGVCDLVKKEIEKTSTDNKNNPKE